MEPHYITAVIVREDHVITQVPYQLVLVERSVHQERHVRCTRAQRSVVELRAPAKHKPVMAVERGGREVILALRVPHQPALHIKQTPPPAVRMDILAKDKPVKQMEHGREATRLLPHPRIPPVRCMPH